MAAVTSAPAPAKSGGLSAKWHGVPVWLLAAGGGGGGFLLYRWWKNRNASSTASSTTAAQTSAATGSTGTGSDYSGAGAASGGGGGGEGAANNALLQQIASELGSLTPGTEPQPSGTGGANSDQPGNYNLTGGPVPSGTKTTPSSILTPAAETQVPQGKVLINAPAGVPGTFSLPKGNVAFQPTAAVKHGGQVAYGIGNPTELSAVKSAGGTVETGKQLAAKGWTGLTPGASYLVR